METLETGTLPLGEDLASGPQQREPSLFQFVTNRGNAIEILTSGIIKPREGFVKYYRDLLDESHDYIPIAVGPLSRDVARLVASSEQNQFPVSMVLDPAAIQPLGLMYLAEDGQVAWRVSDTTIPASFIRRLEFRSEQEMLEFKAREYSNLSIADMALEVNTRMFEGDRYAALKVVEWLRGLPPSTKLNPTSYGLADRTAGALACTLYTIPLSGDWLEAVRLTISSCASQSITPSNVAGMIANWLWSDSPSGKKSSSVPVDARVFEIAVGMLFDTSPAAGIRDDDFLSHLASRISKLKCSARDRNSIAGALDRARKVLANEADLEPITAFEGHEGVLAVLLFLLRPNIEQINKWSGSDTTMRTRVAAAALVGTYAGWSVLPSPIRGTQTWTELVQALISSIVNGSKPSSGGIVGRSISVDSSVTNDVVNTSVRVSESIAWQYSQDPYEYLCSLDYSIAPYKDTALRVTRKNRWPCVRMTYLFNLSYGQVETVITGTELRVHAIGIPSTQGELMREEFLRLVRQDGLAADIAAEMMRTNETK